MHHFSGMCKHCTAIPSGEEVTALFELLRSPTACATGKKTPLKACYAFQKFSVYDVIPSIILFLQ
jgi:hypothetical protein